LRERVRVRLKRNPQPSAGIASIASRSRDDRRGGWRRTPLRWREEKLKGPKRHLLVDTEGFVLKTKEEVISAKEEVMDYEGIKVLLDRAKGLFPRLSQLWLDAGYSREETKAVTTGCKRRLGVEGGGDRQATAQACSPD
jgi:hypothetical protein